MCFISCAAGHASFLEHLLGCVIIGIPTLGTGLLGYGSVSMMYSYVLGFDFLRCIGHANVEVIPHRLFEAIPLLQYIIYTPTYVLISYIDSSLCSCSSIVAVICISRKCHALNPFLNIFCSFFGQMGLEGSPTQ